MYSCCESSARVVGALYATFLASSHFVLQQLWDKLFFAFSLNWYVRMTQPETSRKACNVKPSVPMVTVKMSWATKNGGGCSRQLRADSRNCLTFSQLFSVRDKIQRKQPLLLRRCDERYSSTRMWSQIGSKIQSVMDTCQVGTRQQQPQIFSNINAYHLVRFAELRN